MKKFVSIIAAAALILAARPAAAQCFGGRCFARQSRACVARSSYASYGRYYSYAPTAGYWSAGQCYGVGACAAVESYTPAPCAPTTATPEYYSETLDNCGACESVKTTPPAACAPVESCATCDEYKPVATTGGIVRQACPTGACPLQTAVSSILAQVNATRARYGLRALATDATLEAGSQYQASVCASRGALVHGSGAAEILAQNSQGIETALVQWLNSPAHRALLLSPSFTRAGVAIHRDGSGRAWCAVRFR